MKTEIGKMALTYTWKITELKKTNTNDLNNVIIGTRWECTGTDEDGITGVFSGATPFNAVDVDPNNFIDWNNLTEETVLNWIKAVVVDDYKNHVKQQIQKQIDKKKNLIEEVSANSFPWITE